MRRLALLLALAYLISRTVADDACGDHGHLVDGHCACDNPWPSQGEKGWTGKNCSIPAFGSQADGQDMTSWCQADSCNSLEAKQWVCFAVKFLWNRTDDPWNYFTVQLNRTSTEGDPDLFAIWNGGSRGMVQPNDTAKGFDFQDTSSGLHPLVVKMVSKATFGADKDYEGVYLCVRGYGQATTSFTLRATLDRCPSSFADDGTPLTCGTPKGAPEGESRYSDCTAMGECVCTGQWSKPVPEVFPGLGFESCTAAVTHINISQFEDNRTFVAEHQEVRPDQWRFYYFKVHQTDYQVVVDVASEQSHGYLDMYMKYGQPPGFGPKQFDMRPEWNTALDDKQLEVVLDPTKPQFRTGTWFIGVVGDHYAANFTLTISKYECPMNCSGHGDCVHGGEPQDRQCQCHEGYGGLDCSKATAALAFGAPVSHGLRAFEYDFYTLPSPTEGMKQGSVEVLVEATYWSDGYARHMDIYPALLLAPSDGSAFPSASNYTYKLLLDKQNTTWVLALCPSQLAQGDWKLAVYNPMRQYRMGYNLTLSKQGRCLNNCTAHGECNSDGVCECAASWSGGDCSVSLNASCLAGSRRAARRSDQHGTCWQECSCDEAGKECSYGQDCADFTCDAAPEGQLPFRRKKNETLCVQDLCRKDEWVQTKQYVCLRKCTCTADGSPCTLDAECSNRVSIGRRGISGGAVFWWVVFSTLFGAALMLGYIHYLGVPAWLPVRSRGFDGLYQELSPNEGI